MAILARGTQPLQTQRGLPGDPDDTQSRYLEAAVNGVLVACLYLPNGNPAPGPKFDYKLRWFELLSARAAELLVCSEPVILAGDFNVMPTIHTVAVASAISPSVASAVLTKRRLSGAHDEILDESRSEGP